MNNIITLFLAHFFVLVMLFPSITQLVHVFENHEHEYCGVAETHLHEKKVDCNLLKFISTVLYYNTQDVEYVYISHTYKEKTSHYSFVIHKVRSQSNSLRGPPLFQQFS